MNSSLIEKGKIVLNNLKPRRRLGLFSVFFILTAGVAVLLLVGVQPAHANDISDGIASFIGNAFLAAAAWLMSMTVFVLRFVIEIASYNHYINAPAVTLGWVLVRDITNMFFVVILMLIAFGTVLGIEQYEWKKMLMKFVMAAILVNFSRVICGVIIDAAQVFMMTFISGVAATAGGNLVNAFHMNDILAFSSNSDPSGGLSDFMNVVISGMVAFIFALIALFVIGAYLAMLVARVLALWVCIILSPLAFVLGVIPKFQSYASQWWTEFTNNVIAGPVLAFFLWLAFAVAGGANIHDEFSASSGNTAYDVSGYESEARQLATAAGGDAGTHINLITDWENLANFILAAAFMMVGVKTTQKLSAAGAGMLGSAASAATKFATVATGAAAGMAAAKWAGKTAIAPIKQRLELAKTKIQSGIVRGGEYYNRQMVERGMHAASRMLGGGKKAAAFTGFVGRLAQVGGTGVKLETAKDILEKRKKLFSTSILETKGSKLTQAVATVQVEEIGKKIKEGVVAGRMEQARKIVAEKPAPDRAKGKLVEVADELKAKADRIALEHKREEEIGISKARDNEREKGGQSRIHEDITRAQHTAEDLKYYSHLPYERMMTNIKNQRASIREAQEQIKSGLDTKGETLSVQAKEALKNKTQKMIEDLNDQVVSSIERGASFGPDAVMAGFEHEGVFHANNPEDQKAMLLSTLTQERVVSTPASIADAMSKLEKTYGDQWGAFSSHLATALKTCSKEGAIGMAGIMKIDDNGRSYRLTGYDKKAVIDEATGREKLNEQGKIIMQWQRILDQSKMQEDQNYAKSERDYALSSSRGKPANISFAVDRIISDGKVKLGLGSDEAIKGLATLMPGTRLSVQSMPQWIIGKVEQALVGAIKAGNKDNVEQFAKAMRGMHSSPEATQELFGRFSDETKGLLTSTFKDGIKIQNKGATKDKSDFVPLWNVPGTVQAPSATSETGTASAASPAKNKKRKN